MTFKSSAALCIEFKIPDLFFRNATSLLCTQFLFDQGGGGGDVRPRRVILSSLFVSKITQTHF